jgi:hypothetical protein
MQQRLATKVQKRFIDFRAIDASSHAGTPASGKDEGGSRQYASIHTESIRPKAGYTKVTYPEWRRRQKMKMFDW